MFGPEARIMGYDAFKPSFLYWVINQLWHEKIIVVVWVFFLFKLE